MPPPSRGWGINSHWLWWVLLILLVKLTVSTEDWSTGCQAINCNCRWVHGKKTADCERLNAIPSQLSPEIQVLNISFNDLSFIPKNAFRDVGLVNLHKLFMKGCSIKGIDPGAFNGLEIVIEIDLSNNEIHKLDSRSFQENYRLRLLYLNNNPIEKLEDGLFSNHTFLQTVELNNNLISQIGPKTFINTPQLQRLSFEGNRLSYLKLMSVSHMTKLKSLVLANNPWKCDCKLRPLRDWVEERKLNAQPTKCVEPDRLKDKFWSEIRSEEFACPPQLNLPSSSVAASTSGNVTVACRASGDPPPTINWVLNSLVLGNNSRSSHSGYHQHYFVQKGESRSHLGEYWNWANLTIINVKQYDSGKYACVATNPGGVAEEVLTLNVREGGGGIIANASASELYVWLVSLLVAALVLLVFVLVLCWCLCRRKGRRQHTRNQILKKHEQISNGDLINGEDEQEKALITKINPLQKPPRRIESAQSSMNGSQTTDLNRSHLMIEDGMATGNGGTLRTRTSEGGDDPRLNQSYDSLLDADEFTPSKRHEQLPMRTIAGRPDLLAFQQPRTGHDSPAGSSTSTAPDSTRLSQLHSPGLILQPPPHVMGFGTLPHSRSHSPFSPGFNPIMGSCGSLPIVTNRQGYVTIPRRPRAPSWAAPPRLGDPLLKMDPIYDNLGRRTTVDGSSNSLNSCANSTLTRTPNRSHVRPLPITPQPYLNTTLPKYYAPIEEMDPLPSPSPVRHQISSPAALGKELRMSPEGDDKRRSIANSINGMEEMHLLDNSPPGSEPSQNSPRKKVPPKVPPKPAKRKLPSAASNEPLVEATEEGEDGTEV